MAPQDLTIYDLAEKLKLVAKLLQDIPLSVIKLADENSLATMRDMELHLTQATTKLVAFQKQFDALDEQVFTLSEDSWKKVEEAKRIFERRLGRLEWPRVNPPYGIEETIKIAERCSHLTDKQWERVIELSKALARKE